MIARQIRWLPLILILWLAFLLRVWGLDFGLPYRLHPDEVQYADAALKWYTAGELRVHFVNPPLLIYVLLLALWPWLKLSPVTLSEVWVIQTFLFARLWSVIFGMLTVALVYPLGKRFYNQKAGLAAMILMAGLFLPARESHFAVNDAAATFFVLLAIFFSLGILRRGQGRTYVAAGIAAGLAAATKLTAGLTLLALPAAHFLARPSLKFREYRPLLFGLGAAAVTFVTVSIQLFLNPISFVQDVVTHLQFGGEGYKGAQMAPATGWQYYLEVLGWGIGWLLLGVVGVALLGLIRRRDKAGLVLALFPLILLGYMGGQKILFARFILPAVTPLVVLAAAELALWSERWPVWQKKPALIWPLVVTVLLAQPLANLIWFNHLLTRPDTREIATQWFREHIPENSILVKESYSVFPKIHILPEQSPFKIMVINERSLTNDEVDHYLSRTTQYVALSNYTYSRVRQDPTDEAIRLAQLAELEEKATLIKEFNPYRPGYDGWFYQDQIYGPAGETLQRIQPGPLIKIYQLEPPQLEKLNISVSHQANFADQIHLLGYDLPQTEVKAGEALPLTLYWQAPSDKSPEADFIQFNQLLDNAGTQRGGYDRQPREYYSTHLWAPGEIVVDGYTVPLEADAPPGSYYLNVGYYLIVNDHPVYLPLVVDGQVTDRNNITIGPIEVVAP